MGATGQIEVVNKRHLIGTSPNDIYIGRGSPLGNPYKIGESGSRDQVIRLYKGWLSGQILKGRDDVIDALDGIANRVLDGKTVRLVCFCKPQACHGDVISKMVCDAIAREAA